MANETWVVKRALMLEARQRFRETDVLLDIGCGIMPQTTLVPSVHICVEPYQEYVDVLQQKTSGASDRSFVIIRGTWREALDMLPAKSVDTVILADVIEHIEKAQATELLRRTEDVARQQILIFTPLGFMPQVHPDGVDAWGLGGAHWQEHKSGWTPDDFGEGWETIGTKEYYFEDNLGKPLKQPYGAFWAIRNFGPGAQQQRMARRAVLRRFAAQAERLNYSSLLKYALGAIDLLAIFRDAGSQVYRTLVPARKKGK
jgi:hypothetical protein